MLSVSDLKHRINLLSREQREHLLAWLSGTVDLPLPPLGVAEAVPVYGEPSGRLVSVEEYLELEEKATLRHEYINGVMYAMSGATLVHNRITFQLASALSSRLEKGPCKVFLTDLRLQLELGSDRIFYYPDVMVACRPEEWGKDFIRNPTLVVEVLSPSTQHIDLREKALNYHRAAIQEYVVISQMERQAVVHRYGDRWDMQIVSGSEAVEFRSLGISIPMDEIYGDALV